LISINQDWKEIMPNRRWLAREQLEYYLVYLLLAYLRLIMIAGLLLLVYAIATMFMNLSTGIMISIPAIYLLMLSNSCMLNFTLPDWERGLERSGVRTVDFSIKTSDK